MAEQRRIGSLAMEELARRDEMKRTAEEIKELEAEAETEIFAQATPSAPAQMTESEIDEMTREQLDAVRKQYKGTPQWMKAPNGKKTNLTEKQWLQVRTPAFKKWFGDWEKATVKDRLVNGDAVSVQDDGNDLIRRFQCSGPTWAERISLPIEGTPKFTPENGMDTIPQKFMGRS